MTNAASASAAEAVSDERHVVVVLARSGCSGLERAIALLRRRAPTMEALNVTFSERGDETRLTVCLHSGHDTAQQIAEHIRKLVDVRWVATFPATSVVDDVLLREFALIRVACTTATRRELLDVAQQFGARAVDVTERSVTLELSGSHERIEHLLRTLRPMGVYEVARTGRMAMWRGPDSGKYQGEEAPALE